MVTWMRILNAKGWAAPHWPVEYGGTDWDPVQQYIFREELLAAPAPEPLSFGVSMVGPVIYTFGNQKQKDYFLPRIRNMDDWWCQGFSEPGAGSRSRLFEDPRRARGRSLHRQRPEDLDHARPACRLDLLPRAHQPGCTEEADGHLLPAHRHEIPPGVTLRPIQTLDGGHEVNEIFFDDVKVPAENLVGEENKGWDYAKFLLGNERTGIARIGISKERVRRIRRLASAEKAGERPLIENPRFREKLAALEVELKALEMTQLRVVAEARNRPSDKPDPASSILKIKGSQIQQATTELLLDVVGPYALPFTPEEEGRNEPPIGPEWAQMIAPNYFNTRKVSIYGGSNEIQKNIIAKAILGL